MHTVSLIYKYDGVEVGYGEGHTYQTALDAALECCPTYPLESLVIESTEST